MLPSAELTVALLQVTKCNIDDMSFLRNTEVNYLPFPLLFHQYYMS